jgi:hypothetical protein
MLKAVGIAKLGALKGPSLIGRFVDLNKRMKLARRQFPAEIRIQPKAVR